MEIEIQIFNRIKVLISGQLENLIANINIQLVPSQNRRRIHLRKGINIHRFLSFYFKAIFEKLDGVPEEKRTARFVSCIAAAFPDGRRLISYDTVEGIIGYEAKGENGFGYDPIFFVSEKGRYMAELSAEEKNAISHRGKALGKMKELLKKEL